MKAAVIHENGGPDVLRYEEVPDPECPDGCVLIDVEAISIEGGDLLARAGSPPPSVPHVVGYLAAGTVVETGAGVEDRAVGDRVVTLSMAGSHASRRAVPAMSTWSIPDGLDAAAAACVPVAFGTAQECLFTAGHLEAGQTVLIHAGAGGVGMAGRAGCAVEARELWDENTTLRGVFLGGALLTEYPRVHAMIDDLLARAASGEVRVEIDRTFPLADAAGAHAHVESRRAVGRVVMTP